MDDQSMMDAKLSLAAAVDRCSRRKQSNVSQRSCYEASIGGLGGTAGHLRFGRSGDAHLRPHHSSGRSTAWLQSRMCILLSFSCSYSKNDHR